jgi:hypothetical protein
LFERELFDSNFDASNSFAGKTANFAGRVLYDAIALGVNSEVTASASALTGTLGHTNLTNDNLAILDLLATVYLNTKSLAGTVVDIFGGTTRFNV